MTPSQQPFGILFVDDEEKTLKYFRRLFEKLYPIYTAENVAEAKLILDERHEEIGVLITDQRMPEGKGVELLKYARATYPLITRMLTTAYSDLTDAIDSVNRGEILRYISKPWNIQNLEAEINQGMTFFSLRHERDILLREKISARQRLRGVNRILSLLSMASGFTCMRHPLAAARAIIEQLPGNHNNPNEAFNSGPWSELLEDLDTIIQLADQLKTTSSDEEGSPFATLSLQELLNELPDAIRIGEIAESEIQIEASKRLIIEMLNALANWLGGSEEQAVEISARVSNGGALLVLNGSRQDWQETSVSQIPPELMRAFFFCYHHGGHLTIHPNQPFVIDAFIPSRPILPGAGEQNLDWLEDALMRYENWS